MFLNGAKLQYVDSYKYLGTFIHVRNDDLDIVRQFKCVILRTNILMRTCSSCSVEVKLFLEVKLFQLLLFASVVQFYEGADEQTANNI